MRDRLIRFMQGRYGNDKLNSFIFFWAFVCIILSMFGLRFMNSLALVCIVIAYYRTFSKNIQKRYMENQWYLAKSAKARSFMNKKIGRLKQMRTYKFFKCPTCRQTIRVPKGHGRIEVTCPKCRDKFIKNS